MYRVCAAICLLVVLSSPVWAEVDLARTINLAGKQGMLTQKMAKEVMLIALDVDTKANLANLKASHDEFSRILNGLKNGDAALGLVPVRNPKIQKHLDIVMGLWKNYGATIMGILNSRGRVSDIRIGSVASLSLPLLSVVDRTVKLYEDEAPAQSTDPALAAAINIAGRQRMLTQKMSKEFLLIAQGSFADQNTASLYETTLLFERSLDRLIHGDPSLNLPPAPTPDIKAQLENVQSLWVAFKAHIESARLRKRSGLWPIKTYRFSTQWTLPLDSSRL